MLSTWPDAWPNVAAQSAKIRRRTRPPSERKSRMLTGQFTGMRECFPLKRTAVFISGHAGLFVPLRRVITEVFLRDRTGQVHVCDVCERAQPCDDVGELFFQIRAILAAERRRE